MKTKVKDVLVRALKTFWQAALAYLIASLGTIETFDIKALKNVAIGLGVGAIAAGLSAAWNSVIQPALNKLKDKGGVTTDDVE